MRRSSTSGPAGKVRQLFLLVSAAFLWRPAEALDLEFSHMLWITVCKHIYGGSVDYLRFARCSGGTYCDVGDYNSSDDTQDIVTMTSVVNTWTNRTHTGFIQDLEDGFETALIGPGGTYGFAYSLDVDPTTLVILKEPGNDALCLERVGWQRANSTVDFSLSRSDLLGDSTVIYLNGPEDYAEDPLTEDDCLYDDDDSSYICDPGQRTTCSGGLFTNATTQTESPCLSGWRFFNLQKDADYEYELKMEGCSDSGTSTGASASFCPDPYCNTSDVVEETLGDFDSSSGATIFPVKLGFNPVAIRLSASAEEGWCANAMSFNGFTLAGSYPYEMAAKESRIVKNIQYFGAESTTSDVHIVITPDGTSSSIKEAWSTAILLVFGMLAILLFIAT